MSERENFDDIELIESLLDQTYSKDGKSVEICIYRTTNTPWVVEVIDKFNNSTVWDDEFESDKDALKFVLIELERDGIDAFIHVP